MQRLVSKYIKIQNWVARLKRIHKIRNRRPVLKYLETHIVDHCNLNCKACSHYSPLAQEYFEYVDKFKKNINELSKKLRFKSIRLLGGEPLLHPEINLFIEITNKAFPRAQLSIVTNGILLPKMPQSFWETCRDCSVSIDVSRYPNTEEIFQNSVALIEKNGVKLGDVHDCPDMYVFHNPKGDSEKELAFKYCALKKYTILRDNKIYTCPKTAYIDIYNNFYKLKKSADKGINICFSSAKKILRYLKKPVSTCEYCTYSGRFVEWELSRKNKTEWNAVDDLSLLPQFQSYVLKRLIDSGKKF